METMHSNPRTREESGFPMDGVLTYHRRSIQASRNNAEEEEQVDPDGNTVLSHALMHGWDLKDIRSLLIDGADVNRVNKYGWSPLCFALQRPDCSPDLVHLLLQAGASEHVCRVHKNLLHCYSANAKQIAPGVVTMLVKQIGMGRLNRNSLCLALSMTPPCRADVVKVLLEMGCHVDTCIMHASSFNCYFTGLTFNTSVPRDLDEEVLKLLLGSVTKVRRIYGCLQSPFCYVLSHSSCTLAMVELFLDAEAHFRKCCMHQSDFHCFISSNAHGHHIRRSLNADILKLFLDRGADIQQADSTGVPAIYMALHYFECNADVIKLFVDAGAIMNGSWCAMHGSVLKCYVITNNVKADVIKLLLDNGGDAHEACCNGDTPLHSALRYSKYEMASIKMLMDHPGFDITKRGRNEASFLHCALQNSYYERDVVKLLLNRGARADAVDSRGYTTLEIAVRNSDCDPETIKMLLDNGCPVSTKNENVTPLEVVLRDTRRADIAHLLLVAGAPIDVKRNTDDPSLMELTLSLYDIVQRQAHIDCLEMFLKFSLLVNPHLNLYNLIQGRILDYFKQKDFHAYMSRCMNEIQRMDMHCVVAGVTLRQLAAGLKKEVTFDLDVLLKILASNEFPIYYDIISPRVKKLYQSHAYLISNLPCNGKRKVVLDSESTYHIGLFLSDNDLLSFLIAFHAS